MTAPTHSLLPFRRRKPVPPCNPLGHTWAWVGVYGPKTGERCYCGRSRWRKQSLVSRLIEAFDALVNE